MMDMFTMALLAICVFLLALGLLVFLIDTHNHINWLNEKEKELDEIKKRREEMEKKRGWK